MLISKRLRDLYYMMTEDLSYRWCHVSSLTNRLLALVIISEMRIIIDHLEIINQKLDKELSIDDADLDFDLWSDNASLLQNFLDVFANVEIEDDISIINKIPDLFPLSKSPTFDESMVESLKTGMRLLGSDDVLNHADIIAALKNGINRIVCLINDIKVKNKNIPDDLYEKYCYDFFYRHHDHYYQLAESDYLLWKDEHEWKSLQALKDKRMQEIVKLLDSGVFIHSIPPTNRDIKDCSFKIQEEALEHDTKHPQNLNIECVRFSKFVIIKNDIICFDYVKLGKYLYKNYKEISLDLDKLYSLHLFEKKLNLIQHDMADINPKLRQYLPDYKDNMLKAALDNATKIINSCQKYLKDKNPDDFLATYLKDAFYGDCKIEVQNKLNSQSKYTLICGMLGMLKITQKVFEPETSSEDLAKELSSVIKKPNQDSLERYINEGARDHNSDLSKWTAQYVMKNLGTKEEENNCGRSQQEK